MARSAAPRPIRPAGLRQDDHGQMMILAAVLLVIGLIALAGMVARVNQLGSQTAVESDKAILDEVTPLQNTLDTSVSRLVKRTFSATTAVTGNLITATSATFSQSDIGLNVTGPGLPTNTHILSVTSSTVAVLNRTPAPAQSTAATFTLYKWGFSLTATTYVKAQDAIVGMLEQLQRVQASHGFWMDYELSCGTTSGSSDPAKGQVIARLSDGTVWVEVRSALYFPRSDANGDGSFTAADCTTIRG